MLGSIDSLEVLNTNSYRRNTGNVFYRQRISSPRVGCTKKYGSGVPFPEFLNLMKVQNGVGSNNSLPEGVVA
jgi:hypothetical protein